MTTLQELEGGSVWDDEVYNAFRTHVEEEDRLLAVYRELAASSGAPDVAYLLEMIMSDEQRHHQLFEQLALAVRVVVELEPAESAVPDVPLRRSGSAALRTSLNNLLRFEREDAHRLRKLRHALRPVQETTIWPLLVETMELDTKKHILILKRLMRISGGVFGD